MLAKPQTYLKLLLLIVATSLNANVVELDKSKQLWLINSAEKSLQQLVDLGITDEKFEQWLIPNLQIVLMGEILSRENDLASQISLITKVQARALENNSQLLLLEGKIENELLSGTNHSLKTALIFRWNNHLIARHGISLRAQTDNFDNNYDGATWSNEIHLPMNYLGSQICHPYMETNRLRIALNNLSADTLWVSRADVLPVSDWQQRLDSQLNVLDNNVMVKLTSANDFQVSKNGVMVVAEQSPDRYPANPLGLSDEQIIEILTHGTVVSTEVIPVGITKPLKLTLEYQNEQIDAIFKTIDNSPNLHRGSWLTKSSIPDRFGYEVVAYKLDRMLGIGLVPAVIERELSGKSGSLQVWYDDLISKLGYRQQQITYGGHCDRKAQREMMHVFDYLIRNEDRNQSNMLFNQSDWQVWFIDHSRAFDVNTRRHKSQRKSQFKVTPEFRIALESFSREDLHTLRPWLHKQQVFAIHKRRRNLVRDNY